MRVALLSLFLLLGTLPAGAGSHDPLQDRQWGLDQIKAETAWGTSKGGGITIAVVDTGVDLTHEDLAGPGHVISGRDYVDGGEPEDRHGHGTHVAGIAAALTGNGLGVASVAPEAKILAVRIFDGNGDYSGDGPASIRHAADREAQVINLSWGPELNLANLFDDPDVDAAIRYAFGMGSVVVVAAGNDGYPFSNPSTADVALVVGATTRLNAQAAYSTGGPGVKIWAPGGEVTDVLLCEEDDNIWSTIWPGSGLDEGCGQFKGYDTLSGTSMAAPHVAGVAALVRATNPKLCPKQVMDIILSSADGIAGGLRRVNAAKAVAAAKSTPGSCTPAPSSATSGGGSGQSGTGGVGSTGGGSGSSGAGGTQQAGGPAGASPTTEPGGTQGSGATEGQDGEAGSASDGGESGRNGLLYLVVGALLAAGAVGAVVRARFKASRAPND